MRSPKLLNVVFPLYLKRQLSSPSQVSGTWPFHLEIGWNVKQRETKPETIQHGAIYFCRCHKLFSFSHVGLREIDRSRCSLKMSEEIDRLVDEIAFASLSAAQQTKSWRRYARKWEFSDLKKQIKHVILNPETIEFANIDFKDSPSELKVEVVVQRRKWKDRPRQVFRTFTIPKKVNV